MDVASLAGHGRIIGSYYLQFMHAWATGDRKSKGKRMVGVWPHNLAKAKDQPMQSSIIGLSKSCIIRKEKRKGSFFGDIRGKEVGLV